MLDQKHAISVLPTQPNSGSAKQWRPCSTSGWQRRTKLRKKTKYDARISVDTKRQSMAYQLEDFQRQGQREREDLLSKIEHEKKIIDSDNLTSTQGPLLSSTPVIRTSPSAFPPAEPDASHIPIQQKITTGSSIRWPKITVERFGGDPRKWRKFDQEVNAKIRDTNMPDSLKLISLQDVLVDEIRKKMAHVFNNGFTFEAAWAELSRRYGTPGLIMQAHNAHLLQIQSFRAGDFNSLFALAADVRDAVSSISEDHLAVFTFSTVASSLSTKLPTN